MTLESATYIDDLNKSYPEGAADVSRGDDHLRLIKEVLKNTFPNVSGAVTASQDEINSSSFASGTKMVFYQGSAPSGWTQDTSVNDRVLQVTSGNGGGTGGQWTITGLQQGNLSVNGHQLSEAELPSVSGRFDAVRHQSSNAPVVDNAAGNFSHNSGGGGNLPEADSNASTGTSDRFTFSFGSNNSHTHGLSGSPSHNGNWRPSRIDVIVAEKD